MPRLVELIADFCRWRAACAMRRAGATLARAELWIERERTIIKWEQGNGTEQEG